MHRLFTKPSNKQTQVHQPASGDTEAKGQERKRRNDKKPTLWIACTALILCVVVAGCAFIDTAPKKSEEPPAQVPAVVEPEEEPSDTTTDDRDTAEEIKPATEEAYRPTKDEVLSRREKALEGMSEEEIERLTENIKVANLQMESAYLNDNLFGKLSDKDSPYWLYFDQKGEIQLGWWYKQEIRSMDFIMKQENITEEE